VDYDFIRFESSNNKAHTVLNSKSPPPKIGGPEAYGCRMCHMNSVCHHGQKPLKNCRSCKSGEPAENATWVCGKGHEFGTVCGEYEAIT